MRTHEYGRDRFWAYLKVRPDTPLWHAATTYQGTYPYHWCERAVIIRISRRHAVMLGRWQPRTAPDISQHLARALSQMLDSECWDARMVSEDNYHGADPARPL